MSDPIYTIQWLDYLAIGMYLAMLAVLGLSLGRKVRDVGTYFKGGGTLPWQAAAVSNFMAMLSTFVFVAYAGIAYEHGLVAVTIFWCTIPPSLFAAAVIGKRWRRAGVMTPTEYLEVRFNISTRQFLGWCGISFRLLDNMVRLYAIAVFMTATTALSLELSIIMAGLVVLVITVSGGLWAVVLIDVVQFVVLICAMLVLVPMSICAAGGLGTMVAEIPDHFSFFNGSKGAPLFLLAYYLMVLIKYNGNWSFIQRFYSVRDEAAGRKTGLLMAGLFFVTPLVFMLPAIAARVVIPDLADPEQAYAAIALRVLPPGIMGLLMAAMLGATLDTVAAEFNVTAGVFTKDIYQRLLRQSASPRELMWVARCATFVIGCLVVIGAMFVGRFGGAFTANMVITGLAIPLSVPLVLGILLRRARPWGTFAVVFIGVPTGIILNLHPNVSWPIATLSVIGVSSLTWFIAGLMPSPDPEYRSRVAAFFSRLSTPIPEDQKPQTDPAFSRALVLIFSSAFLSVGVLYFLMSLPSLKQLSGLLAMAASVMCFALALGIHRINVCPKRR